MSELPDFGAFFGALWGYGPFPWQTMLAERVVEEPWPQALDLPTAAGKTACIDVAVYALAAQAGRAVAERTAPRRVWFVVDRRIVVDEAFERADAISRKLAAASDGPLKAVADRLREVAGTDHPLAVGRLRGGILRDDGWARVPSQSAVITSTVDQVGSRLLFRPYGPSRLAAPIYAGLAANDSLIILDEAHCSVPFLQTLRSIEEFRNAAWAASWLATPFAFVTMTATPPPGVPAEAVFPGTERERALHHPDLARRLGTSKLAELVELKLRAHGAADPLVQAAADRAIAYLQSGRRRVGVMVNRVAVAEQVTRTIVSEFGERADVLLLTGRMRSLEMDSVVRRWKPYLRAVSPEEPERPVVVVATQTLEVGADFSFDALVSEVASLDALRQRFGRLARMGTDEPAPAVILARERDVREGATDPVYGPALFATWGLLTELASDGLLSEQSGRLVDFGVDRLGAMLEDLGDLSRYLAQADDAPMLLPAHLDLLCQTAPPPHPEPDVSLFLHGKGGGAPEVQVVWRADLTPEATKMWAETVALCRPTSGEMLSVPLNRLRDWLAHPEAPDLSPDVEGIVGTADDADGPEAIRPCLLWRGRDQSRVVRNSTDIGPGDVVVLPVQYGMEGLGQSVPGQALGDGMIDLWEPAFAHPGRAGVRLQRAVLKPWLASPPLADLVVLAEAPVPDRDAIQEGIAAVLNYEPAGEDAAQPSPDWWRELLRRSRHGRFEQHPAGGLVLFARTAVVGAHSAEPDLFADDDDLTSGSAEEVSLLEHSELVRETVGRLAACCLPPEFGEPLRRAGYLHDLGKLDGRFQVLLRQGDELAVALQDRPIAKSQFVPLSPGRRRTIRESSGLPSDFRHELVSLQILEYNPSLLGDTDAADLVMHLVASHHGHARPFGPVSDDPQPPDVAGSLGETPIDLPSLVRRTMPPPHRVDSGLAERFWRLVRRYGWWGLAYLEAVLRLGDWYASRLAERQRVGDQDVEVAR